MTTKTALRGRRARRPDNRAAAPLHAEEAARIVVEVGCLSDDLASGQFVDAAGPVPW